MPNTAYERVYTALRDLIVSGEYCSGQRLPTERQLSEQFGVSRITTRHALSLLQDDGYVERRRGAGTLVRSQNRAKVPIVDGNYVGTITEQLPGLRRKLVNSTMVTPPADIRDSLGILPGERCWVFERLDLVDDEPLACDRLYVSASMAVQLDEPLLIAVDFLARWLAREGITSPHLRQSIEAMIPDDHTASLLKLASRDPVLVTEETVIGRVQGTIAVVVTYYRSDRWQLVSTTTISGTGPTPSR